MSFNRAMDAFQHIHLDPVTFGQKNKGYSGASDGAKGVQWNFIFQHDTGETRLGINLEGMKYKGWPITSFIQKELASSSLVRLKELVTDSFDPTISFRRDAWQAASRLDIVEKFLGGATPNLSELDPKWWESALEEALTCLDRTKKYRGRVVQDVTLAKNGEIISREVSPHLSITTQLWETAPSSHESALSLFEESTALMKPIYELVKDLAAMEDVGLPGEKKEFSYITAAAQYAQELCAQGSVTKLFLKLLIEKGKEGPRGKFTVNPNRLVWWDEGNERMARIDLQSNGLKLVAKNQLLEGVSLPEDAKPHKKNQSMTDCFTKDRDKLGDLVEVFF